MTCKSLLVDTLNDSPLYWLSWILSNGCERPSKQNQLSISGISQGFDAFYPKSFVLTSGKEFLEFQLYYWQTYCESYLKDFVKLYNAESADLAQASKFFKEKVLICLSIVKR